MRLEWEFTGAKLFEPGIFYDYIISRRGKECLITCLKKRSRMHLRMQIP